MHCVGSPSISYLVAVASLASLREVQLGALKIMTGNWWERVLLAG
jgi:hypothetical protein